MSSTEGTNSSDTENICCVCFKNFDIYSIGICDHAVCFECSTRMRVLCQQSECPICRQDMPKVYFSRTLEPYSELAAKYARTNLQDRDYGMCFCSLDIQHTYYALLEYRCQTCRRNYLFKTFNQLKDHMRREHELFYCDICVENLKIFSFERRCYTRQDLAHHRRKGDKDNTSHRGHPICEFCDTRYMDSDELFRHLRRQHLFCHFCDADGKHQYYSCVDDLKRHFRDEHYLCEEGECKNEPLTSAYRTDIDLKAHITSEHSRYMTKSATKQARTLEVEFTLAPRLRRTFDTNRRTETDDYGLEGVGSGGGTFVNPLIPQNFPALGEGASTRPASTPFSSVMTPLNGEDFPTLGGRSSAITITTNSSNSRNNRAPEVTITKTLKGKQALQNTVENFPPLGGASSSTVASRTGGSTNINPTSNGQVRHPSKLLSIHITSSSGSSASSQQKQAEAFPALGKSSTKVVSAQPQWVQQKPKKQEPKVSKVAPAPQLPPSDLSQFPTLSRSKSEKSSKTTTSVTVPVSDNWVNLTSAKNTKNSTSDKGESSRLAKNKPKDEPDFKLYADGTENKSKNKKKKNKNGGGGDTNNVTADAQPKESDTQLNGLVKKRSELKIGTLSNTGQSSSISQPPPGFSVKPPPGFDNFPALTFTNSTGQSYAITPSKTYQEPMNFSRRNQDLGSKIMSLVQDNEAIRGFKQYTQLFREGTMPADKYYYHCREVMSGNFEEVFPEMLVLLPDIEKQQELFAVHNGKSKKNLVVCENCKQVVFRRELSEHYHRHNMESQFPTLGKATQVNSVWKK